MPLKKSVGNMYDFVSHTWSPVRGRCKHDCSYCMPRNTIILMHDFSSRYIHNIKKGDKVIGIEKQNGKGYNKFTITTVVDVSQRKEKTIIISTEDSEIECTLEHPLLGSTKKRGGTDWKKAGSFSPYEQLRYIGEPVEDPKEDSAERQIGWLSGFCDGDGCFFVHKNKYKKEYLGFEAVCTDIELRQSIISIAKKHGIILKEGKKYNSDTSYSPTRYNKMVFSRADKNVKKLKTLIKFSKSKSYNFYMGYLAGMLDSDGSVDKNKCIRIYQSKSANKKKYDRIILALKNVGFDYTEEKNGIRIKTNFETRMRFLFEGKPKHSIKRERLIIGSSYKGYSLSEITNISKGSMASVYNLQTQTSNFIANGFIVHNCYMKKWGELPPMHIDENDLMTNLGEDRFIFVGHTIDLFADDVPSEWIERVLWRCREYPTNKYLFQSKNPARFAEFLDKFPPDVVFGTTIETNRTIYVESKAPAYMERADAIGEMKELVEGCETIVTIEPIYDFDLEPLVEIIVTAKPTWINIGADSKDHDLPEPSKEQIVALIEALDNKMEVRKKNNLKRILGKEL